MKHESVSVRVHPTSNGKQRTQWRKEWFVVFCLNISVLDLWTMHGFNVITEYKHKCPYISVIKNIYYCDIILCMCGRFFYSCAGAHRCRN